MQNFWWLQGLHISVNSHCRKQTDILGLIQLVKRSVSKKDQFVLSDIIFCSDFR